MAQSRYRAATAVTLVLVALLSGCRGHNNGARLPASAEPLPGCVVETVELAELEDFAGVCDLERALLILPYTEDHYRPRYVPEIGSNESGTNTLDSWSVRIGNFGIAGVYVHFTDHQNNDQTTDYGSEWAIEIGRKFFEFSAD